MVLNMYNKKKKLRECAPTFVSFGFSNQKMALFRGIPHILCILSPF
ncbi:hypothetical protein TSAR_005363 [Trichomalopsis sarcophagae]|uniref:Uncharacterized protein n=1 Tax=Trichomalopsis sarcophagae TaxID=543379 RepID=A0A232FDN1_9HYME|nr:hypothetical protein TSAR_005363 [Trichomalopsis sarcophagae]